MIILWFILLAVLAVWFFGLMLNIAGGLIHVLLVVALVILVYNLVSGRRSAA